MHHRLTRRALAGALVLALSPSHALAQDANNSDQAQKRLDAPTAQKANSSAKAKNLDKVTVTGSRIARSEVEGPAPVTIISGAQLKKQGFTTVYELMNSLTQTSMPESPTSYGSTSVNARQVNLRNLGSGRSLLLIDGHRVDDYPQPAAGKSNFQNYNNIPTGMIERVEVLANGASSIYGSDAVAGVVNVILKKDYQGDDIKLRAGTSTRGGRDYGDFNLTGGRSGDHWHVVYNLERQSRGALFGRDRPYSDSDDDAGYGAYDANARLFGYKRYDGLSLYNNQGDYPNGNGNYIAPPAGACGRFGKEFNLYNYRTAAQDGHTVDPNNVTDHGSYCAQRAEFENWVLSPGRQDRDGYIGGEYDFGNGLTAYGSAALYNTRGISNTELPYFYPEAGIPGKFYDRNSGQLITNYFRQITRQEMGTYGNTHDDENNYDIRLGLRGTVFDDKFNWDLNLGHSRYIVHEHYTGLNEQGMFDYFFGPQVGAQTVDGAEYPAYAINYDRYYSPMSTSDYHSFGVGGENSSASWMDSAELNVTGDLFDDWAGPVGFAGVFEANHQGYKLSPDPKGNNNYFSDPFFDFNTGGGTRTRLSTAAEFRIPLLSNLTLTAAGRLDKYRDASATGTARTYSGSFEYRPVDGLLLRGTYGTNFHAPDLQYIYKQDSATSVGIYADPYNCILTGDTSCQARQYSTYYTAKSLGGRTLKPEKGHSWTYGFVLDVPGIEGLALNADYFHIGIDNAIDNQSQDTVLTDEAGCRTGLQVSGAPYTLHAQGSAYCQQIISQVQRDATGAITSVTVMPINQSRLYVGGVDAGLTYQWSMADYGNFNVRLDWTDNLSYKLRILPSDPDVDTNYAQLRTKTRGTFNWNNGPWDATLYWSRYGSVRAPNYGGCRTLPNGIRPSIGDPDCDLYHARLTPYIIYSTQVGYRFNDKLKLNAYVSNIFDKVGSIPYYAGGFEFISRLQGADYVGREVSLELDYKLD